MSSKNPFAIQAIRKDMLHAEWILAMTPKNLLGTFQFGVDSLPANQSQQRMPLRAGESYTLCPPSLNQFM